ncbi:zinc finger protein 397-like isoform X2 [Elgaria multicarinata webbii]|uniref:zinc finger protein 397-like isoform X2 n=1 Tax=Elgaria multicarinata webbii TaxID=159646 RepID=UPI002FCD3555
MGRGLWVLEPPNLFWKQILPLPAADPGSARAFLGLLFATRTLNVQDLKACIGVLWPGVSSITTPRFGRRLVKPGLNIHLRPGIKRMMTTVLGLQNEVRLERGLPPVVKTEEQDPEDSLPEESLKHVGKHAFLIQAGTSGELLRWVASQQSRKENQEISQCREVRWQETVAPEITSPSSPAWGSLQVPQLTLADDIEDYLCTFERVADACQWPRKQWVGRLVPALSGAAQRAYSTLDSRDRGDYGKVKAAILGHSDIASETLRQCFRRFCFREAEGPRQACGSLRELCCRWLKPEIRTKEHILELLILEQFLSILPEEMQTWVWECQPETCAQAVALAEEFVLRQQESERSDLHVTVRMKVEEVALEEEATSPAALWDVPGSQTHPGCLSQESGDWRHPQEPQHELTCVPREDAQPLQEMGARATSRTSDRPLEDSSETPRNPWGNTGEATSSEREEDRRPGERDDSSEDELAIQSRGPRKALTFLPSQTMEAKVALQEPKDTGSQARTFFRGEKPHQCRECGESFRAKQELALHKGIHRRERPFPCAVCGKRFTRLYHLTTHLRIHSGEKPYHCAECGKCYADASNFYKHQRSHSAQKPYQCTECGKTFGDPSSFYKHQKRHQGDRPYVCDVCGDCFSKQKDLLAHQRIHEGGRGLSLF